MAVAAYLLLEELEDLDQMELLNIRRRQLRDNSNPFELRDVDFVRHFRVSKDIALLLCNRLQHFLQRQRSTGLPIHIQFIALQFFAYGSNRRRLLNNCKSILRKSVCKNGQPSNNSNI